MAVGRFVKVGEAIADENWDLKEEIKVACIEAKQAGTLKPVYTNFIALDIMTNDGLVSSKNVYCLLILLVQMRRSLKPWISFQEY